MLDCFFDLVVVGGHYRLVRVVFCGAVNIGQVKDLELWR